MPQQSIDQLLASCLGTILTRAGAELASSLGSPMRAETEPWGRVAPGDLADRLAGRRLVVSGALRGSVEGKVSFVLREEDGIRLAARASSLGEAELEERLRQPLSEADMAATAFVLARVGAAGTDACKELWEADVRWPSEASELTATSLDLPAQAAELCPEQQGESGLAAVAARLSGAVDAEMIVLLPWAVAEALARLASGETAMGSARPSEHWNPARLLPVAVSVRAVVARRSLALRQLLELAPGRVLDLAKPWNQPLELVAGSTVVARGKAVVSDNRFGFRVLELASSSRAPR